MTGALQKVALVLIDSVVHHHDGSNIEANLPQANETPRKEEQAFSQDDCQLVEKECHSALGIHCCTPCEKVEPKACNEEAQAQHRPRICACGLLQYGALAVGVRSAIESGCGYLVLLFCHTSMLHPCMIGCA